MKTAKEFIVSLHPSWRAYLKSLVVSVQDAVAGEGEESESFFEIHVGAHHDPIGVESDEDVYIASEIIGVCARERVSDDGLWTLLCLGVG